MKMMTVDAVAVIVRFLLSILELIIILIFFLEIYFSLRTIVIIIRDARYTIITSLAKMLNV